MENVIDFFFKVVKAADSKFTRTDLAQFFKESVLRHSKQRLNISVDKARASAPRVRKKLIADNNSNSNAGNSNENNVGNSNENSNHSSIN